MFDGLTELKIYYNSVKPNKLDIKQHLIFLIQKQ